MKELQTGSNANYADMQTHLQTRIEALKSLKESQQALDKYKNDRANTAGTTKDYADLSLSHEAFERLVAIDTIDTAWTELGKRQPTKRN